MAASYPSSIKSFTTKVDNVDDVMAADVNSIQDEVVAIETALGASMVNVGLQKSQSGTVTTSNGFTISSLVAGTKYKLIYSYKQNTSSSYCTVRINSDSATNYNYGTTGTNGAHIGQTGKTAFDFPGLDGTSALPANNYMEIWIEFIPNGNTNNITHVNGGYSCTPYPGNPYFGFYNGSAGMTTITVAVASGTMSGAWTLYSLS
jgi:hypothetical protein